MFSASILCPSIHRALPIALPGPDKGWYGLLGDLPYLFCPDCRDLDRSAVSLDVQDPFAGILVLPNVLFKGQIAPFDNVAIEEVWLTRSAASLRLPNKRNHIVIQHFSLTVIRVQGYIDGIPLGHAVHMLGDGDGPQGPFLRYNPEAKAVPPVETWMMPSLLLSARPFKTPLAVVREVTLMVG